MTNFTLHPTLLSREGGNIDIYGHLVSEDLGKLTMKMEGGGVSPFPWVCKLLKLICVACAFLCFVLFSGMRLRNPFILAKELSWEKRR